MMILRIRKFGLSLLNMKYLLFVPLLILWVAIPVLTQMYGSFTVTDSEISQQIADLIISYIPLFSIWWHVFTLKDLINSDLNELCYVYDMQYRSRLPETVALIVLYLASILPCWVLLGERGSDPHICMAMQFAAVLSVLYSALTYCLSYVLRNSYLAMTLLLLYYILCVGIRVESPVWSVYYLADTAGLLTPIPWFLAASALFLFSGYITDKLIYKPKL